MTGTITDNSELFEALIGDAEEASALWAPTAYWRAYVNRITREIRRVGIARCQSNYRIGKGFASCGVPEPQGPAARWKHLIWHGLSGAPVFSRILGEYRRIIAAEHTHRVRAEVRHARSVLDAVAERFPDFRIPEGLASGDPDDDFVWRKQTVTASWVLHLVRLADFYAIVPPERVAAIFEIGPGLGLSTLAHRALNPHLRLVANLDIVPTLYVSTQFLRASGEFDVVDYLGLRGKGSIRLEPGNDRPRLYQLPPWSLPQSQFGVDFFFNAFSFQEMEPEVCANYAQYILARTSQGALLHSAVAGHAKGAGGQKTQVTMGYLVSLLSEAFPESQSLSGLWTSLYDEDPQTVMLLRRPSTPN